MNLRQLECFRALMVGGTTIRAAELIGLSQPAISNTISVLEHQLGLNLFERKAGRLRPTPEAILLYEEVRRSLLSIERLSDYAKAIKDRQRGSLTIVAFPGMSIRFLPNILSEYLSDKPGVNVRLISRSSHIIQDLLSYQRFDLAVNESPLDKRDSNVTNYKYKCVCALPRKHKLAKKKVITPKDLHGVPFISLFKDHQVSYQMANVMSRAGVEWNVIAEVQYFASACEFVSSGLGVTIVDPIISKFNFNDKIIIKPFKPSVTYELSITTPKDKALSELGKGFNDFLQNNLEKY